jgi:hypothetical protein
MQDWGVRRLDIGRALRPLSAPAVLLPGSAFNAVAGWTHTTHRLSRTPASNGSQRKVTVSAWIKRATVGAGTYYWFVGGGLGGGNLVDLRWESDTLSLIHTGGGSVVESTNTYSSTTAWYHVVIAIDTDQATAANRVRMYVNNTEVTYSGGTTYPALNADMNINTTGNTLILGDHDFAGTAASQKLAHVHFIDGAQLTPSAFTQGGAAGTVPKQYTGSFGTNGWLMDFANSSAIGNDVSGNNLDLTVTGLTSGNVTAETVFY